MSCMEKPHTFLSQLKDHDLISEDKYNKVSSMKNKENMKKGLYEILDCLERKQSQRIKTFWTCVFKETIMNQYPTLRLLRNSLLDVPESVEKADEGKRKELSEDEEEEEEEGEKKQENSVKKKRKLRSSSLCDNDEEEQPGPSSQFTPRKKSKELCFLSESAEEEEEEDCDRDMEQQVSSSSRESFTDVTDEVGELEEQTEQQPGASSDSGRKVFKVTCGALAGTLHIKRFASGTCGKSIRTETSWMTPVEFWKKASSSCQLNGSWRKDIKWEGKPINALLEAKILTLHSLLCICKLCKPDSKDLENQKNNECCICKTEEEEELVVCDYCPRSFHQKCHLPHLKDAMLRDHSPWMCTFCVFGNSKTWLYVDELEREAAMSRRISHCVMQCQYLLLYLHEVDEEQIFATNPCLYLTDYSAKIKTPMWLGNVADKLQKRLYQTVGEFVSDIRLIFTNCASYNRDKAEFLAMGNTLKNLFNREFNNVFNIKEGTVE
ncbi:nuclear body protein SP140-like protein isoform X5 [Etheostoma spectabile]|uniref:nuclear body protein SP140-like protein isoform X5 n=1 Tax=Etheostoma spectabile TaxID=54343 RepID=UPI0013AFCA45|nr:nuclear body protein SP140-like protein isoform X5 [Etheostoma spectabile]